MGGEKLVKLKGMHDRVIIESWPFSLLKHKWRVMCCPKGYGRSNEGYVSLYLIHKSDSNLKVLVEFHVMCVEGTFLSPKGAMLCEFSNKRQSHGYDRFVLFSEASLWIQYNCLTIKVIVHEVIEFNMVQSMKLQEQLGSLLDSQIGSDVLFEVDGQCFPAHKCILAARSPVFRVMLFGDMKESRERVVKISDIKAPVFKLLLYFIYTDSLPLPMIKDLESDSLSCELTEKLRDLLVAADMCGMEDLKALCEGYLCRDVNLSTVALLLVVADRHGCSKLLWACLDYINTLEILNEVAATEGFLLLMESSPHLVKDLMEDMGVGSFWKHMVSATAKGDDNCSACTGSKCTRN